MIGPVAWLAAALTWAAAPLWAATPDWVVSGKSQSHPSALYVVGTGSSTESVDLARQAAMADVVRQIRARVRSSSEDEHWEESSTTAGRSRGESSWTGAQVKATEEVEGIQIAETARDGKTWYAMAVLDKSAYAAPGRTAMREADEDGIQRGEDARKALDRRRPLEALDDLHQIEVDRSRFRSGRERAALGEPEALDESFSIPHATCDSLQREIAGGFQFHRSKDSIATGADATWPDSAGLAVGFRGSPVVGLEVDLVDPAGQILGTAKTDSTGFAAPKPSRLPTEIQSIWTRWAFRPRLDLRPHAEIGLAVRIVRSTARVRLNWSDAIDDFLIASIEDRLTSAGWSIDRGQGTPIASQLQLVPKGEVQGFSGSLHRMEARLVLSRNSARIECVGVGTGRTSDLAAKNAIERMPIPPEAIRELLGER